MHSTESGSIVLENWREFNAVKGGVYTLEDSDMTARLDVAFNDALAHETIRQMKPVFEITPEDIPTARQACEETLATKGLWGVYTRFMGIKRSAKRVLKITNPS